MINFKNFLPSEELNYILGDRCYHILSCYYDEHKQKILYKVEAAFRDEEAARFCFGKFYARMHYILVYRGGFTAYFMNQDKIEWYQTEL